MLQIAQTPFIAKKPINTTAVNSAFKDLTALSKPLAKDSISFGQEQREPTPEELKRKQEANDFLTEYARGLNQLQHNIMKQELKAQQEQTNFLLGLGITIFAATMGLLGYTALNSDTVQPEDTTKPVQTEVVIPNSQQ